MRSLVGEREISLLPLCSLILSFRDRLEVDPARFDQRIAVFRVTLEPSPRSEMTIWSHSVRSNSSSPTEKPFGNSAKPLFARLRSICFAEVTSVAGKA